MASAIMDTFLTATTVQVEGRNKRGGNKEAWRRSREGWPFQGGATISWMIILSVFREGYLLRGGCAKRLKRGLPASAGFKIKGSGGEGSRRLLLAVREIRSR